MSPLTYSNPRTEAVIEGWPSGPHRTVATFRIERHPVRGERGTRFTIDPKTGRPGAVKALTYARKARIVDGSDGRTYVAELSTYGFVTFMRSDTKIAGECVHPGDPRLPGLLNLFEEAAQ